MRKKNSIIMLFAVIALSVTGCAREEANLSTCLEMAIQRDADGESTLDKGLVEAYGEVEVGAYRFDYDFLEDNECMFRFDWIKPTEDVLLENLTFDMKKSMEEAEFGQAGVMNVFYDGEEDTVWIIISTISTAELSGCVWTINFSVSEPEVYEIAAYPGFEGWFGNYVMAEDTIYYGETESVPFRLKDGVASYCRDEYEAAAQCVVQNAPDQHLYWFRVIDQIGDVTIYRGYIQEQFDDLEINMDVYVASSEEGVSAKVIEH